jgi:uracil phosphoribosyltransferase
MLTVLDQQNSIFNHFMAELRDVNIQRDSMRFRKNLERIGGVFAYEISKQMNYVQGEVITPLGKAKSNLIAEQPVVATILRAGLPLHYGVLNYFDRAENAFVAAFRKHTEDGIVAVEVDYMACPDLTGKTLILCDPMLATGTSMYLVYEQLLKRGMPKYLHIIAVIASEAAVNYVKGVFPANTNFWIGSVDKELNSDSYIVPGLGDAGDLAFGEKI